MTEQTAVIYRTGSSRVAWGAFALFITAVLIGLLLHLGNGTRSDDLDGQIAEVQEARVGQCIQALAKVSKPEDPNAEPGHTFEGRCYLQLQHEDELKRESIRRHAYERQQSETAVLMWLVVAITFSGVALAALQMAGSYKLAQQGKESFSHDSALSVEMRKLSLNTSVTGLLILIVSFAFFYVFTFQIYSINENSGFFKSQPRQIMHEEAPGPASPGGTLPAVP